MERPRAANGGRGQNSYSTGHQQPCFPPETRSTTAPGEDDSVNESIGADGDAITLPELTRQTAAQVKFDTASFRFADHPSRNVAGDEPYSAPGDFTTPNAEYFDHAFEVIQHAADRGFAILLASAYLGYGGGDEGWYVEMLDNGVDALRDQGRFVGERFASSGNIIWLLGGDVTPPPEGVELVDAVHQGLLNGGATQPDVLSSPGSLDMVHVRTLFDTIPWTDLKSDVDPRLVIDGAGEFASDDFAVAASTPRPLDQCGVRANRAGTRARSWSPPG